MTRSVINLHYHVMHRLLIHRSTKRCQTSIASLTIQPIQPTNPPTYLPGIIQEVLEFLRLGGGGGYVLLLVFIQLAQGMHAIDDEGNPLVAHGARPSHSHLVGGLSILKYRLFRNS